MDSASLEFARPVWLYAGVGLSLLAAGVWVWSDRRRELDLARLMHARFRDRLLPGLSRRMLGLKRGLWLGGAFLLCAAAAGPRMGYEWRDVHQRGIDILFAVDTSRSMLAEDLTPNRLERARMGIQDFVERLNGDRVGLIPFAGSAFAMCPLTTDYDAFRQSLRTLNTELIPRQGTDVASAIREAKRLFDEQKNNHRIVVLMTDGEDFQDDVNEAVAEAKKDGMTIFTIGVASAEGGQIPITNERGVKDVVRDEAGHPVITKLGEEMLRKTAESTGGLYTPLGRGAEGLEMIYQEKLRLVPQQEREASVQKIPLERFGWPLAVGLLLLIVEFLLPDRRRESRPKSLPSAARRQVAMPAMVFLLGAGLAGELRAKEDPRVLYNQGTAAYEAGDFDKAAESLRGCLRTTDLKLQSQAYYNLGNTLFRSGQSAMEKEPAKVEELWKASVKAYEDALALNSGDEDAQYNRDLVQRKLDNIKKQKNQNEQEKDGEQKDGKEEKQDGEKQKKQDGEKQNGKGQQSGENQQQGKDAGAGDQNEQPDPEEAGAQENPDGGKNDPSNRDGDAGKREKSNEPGTSGTEEGEQNKKDASGDKDGVQKPGEGKEEGKKEGEKKDGTSSASEGDQQAPAGDADRTTFSQRRKPGEMSAEEARQLLKTMRGEEASVLPYEQWLEQQQMMRERRFRAPASSTKGKTW